MALLLNVLLDNFVSDIATADAEVPARPHVAAPELSPEVRKLMHQLVGSLSFQHLEQPTDGDLRRDTHEQMHMIFRDVSLDDCYFLMATDFADQFPEPCADFPCHDRLAVLGDPGDVQVNLEESVRAAPVIFHARNLAHGAALHTY